MSELLLVSCDHGKSEWVSYCWYHTNMLRVSEWVIVGIIHTIMVRVSELLLISWDHGKSEWVSYCWYHTYDHGRSEWVSYCWYHADDHGKNEWVIEDNSKWEIFSYTKKKQVAFDDMISALY